MDNSTMKAVGAVLAEETARLEQLIAATAASHDAGVKGLCGQIDDLRGRLVALRESLDEQVAAATKAQRAELADMVLSRTKALDDLMARATARLAELKDGERGPPGEKGMPGDPGTPGARGEAGPAGPPGRDAAPDAVAAALVANEAHRKALTGPQGPAGPPGSTGEKGDPGLPGREGVRGPPGEPGPRGEKGMPGDPGPVGPVGPEGPPGRDGKDLARLANVHRSWDFAHEFPAGHCLTFGGSTYQAKRAAYGDPYEDPDSWEERATGVEFIRAEAVSERDVVLHFRQGRDAFEVPVHVPGAVHRGLWQEGVGYQQGDEVSKDGATWRCLRATTSQPPGEDWTLAAARGKSGRPGGKGDKGDKGDPGVGIAHMELRNGHLLVETTDHDVATFDLQAVFKEFWEQFIGPLEGEDDPIRQFCGEWVSDRTYSRGDIVRFSGRLWLARKSVARNVLPSEGEGVEDWRTFTLFGNSGAGGPQAPVASPFNVLTTTALLPAAGAATGDTYYTLDDHLLRVWDAAGNTWNIIRSGMAIQNGDPTAPGIDGQSVFSIASRSVFVFDGATGTWQKTASGALVLPNAAAQTALGALNDGIIAFRSDTGELLVHAGGQWVAPADVRVVDDRAGRLALPNPRDGHAVYQRDVDKTYVYDGTVWHEVGEATIVVADAPGRLAWPTNRLRPGQLLYQEDTGEIYVWDKGQWAIVGGGAGGIMTVPALADLYALAPNGGTVAPGSVTALVTSLGMLFMLKQSPQNGTIDDWTQVGDGPILHVAVNGELHLLPDAIVPTGVLAYVDDFDGAGNMGMFRRRSTGRLGSMADWEQVYPTKGGVTIVSDAAALPVTADDGEIYVVFADNAGNEINKAYIWDANKGANGGWLEISHLQAVKAQQGLADRPGPHTLGDVQFTLESGLAELKVWNGQAWITLFSEEAIKRWIATSSLFQSAVNLDGIGGATSIRQLPMPEASNRGQYWTWAGDPNFLIEGASTDPALHEITVTVTPGATPADAITLDVAIAGGGDAGVARDIIGAAHVEDSLGVRQAHIVVTVDPLDDAPAIAAKIKAAIDAIGNPLLTVAVAGTQVTITPTAPLTIASARFYKDGATYVIGEDLAGSTLQVGDWIQSNGVNWIHIPADLLNYDRWLRLGGLLPWSDGNWEAQSLVYFDEAIYRARTAVQTGDMPPSVPANPVTIKGVRMELDAGHVVIEGLLFAMPPNPQNGGRYYVATDSGTINVPGGGQIQIAAGEALMNLGNPALGTNGYANVGPVTVPPNKPAHDIQPQRQEADIDTVLGMSALSPDPQLAGSWAVVTAPNLGVPWGVTGYRDLPVGSTIMALEDFTQGDHGYHITLPTPGVTVRQNQGSATHPNYPGVIATISIEANLENIVQSPASSFSVGEWYAVTGNIQQMTPGMTGQQSTGNLAQLMPLATGDALIVSSTQPMSWLKVTGGAVQANNATFVGIGGANQNIGGTPAPQPPAPFHVPAYQPQPSPHPQFTYQPGLIPSKWERLILRTGLINCIDDTMLPQQPPSIDTLVFVATSARAGMRPALYRWNTGLSDWQQIGGAGTDHPFVIYADATALAGDAPTASNVIGYVIADNTYHLWDRQSLTWSPLNNGLPAEIYASKTALDNASPANGTLGIVDSASAGGVHRSIYIRTNNQWATLGNRFLYAPGVGTPNMNPDGNAMVLRDDAIYVPQWDQANAKYVWQSIPLSSGAIVNWRAQSYAAGSLVIYQGGVFESSEHVGPTDPPPLVPSTTLTATLQATPADTMDPTNPDIHSLQALADGRWFDVSADFTYVSAGGLTAWNNRDFHVGDRFLKVGDATVNGNIAGTQIEIAEGIAYFPAGSTFPATTAPVDIFIVNSGKWKLLDIYPGTIIREDEAALPNIAIDGQMAFVRNTFSFYTWSSVANKWDRIVNDGSPVGTIIQHVSITPPPGYLLCDGSAVPNGTQYSALRALVGNNLPDLRDQFVRAAQTQAQIDGFTKHSDTTRRPRTNALTGGTNNPGDHYHPMNVGTGDLATYYSSHQDNIAFNNGGSTWTVQGSTKRDVPAFEYAAGGHTHTVTINGGGDSETAPVHVRLAMHIKY